MPFSLRKNVRQFYDNLLRKKTVFDERDIIESLPPQLKKEMVYALYAPIIHQAVLFVGLEDEVITKLCLALAPFHVVAGVTIYREGHVGREVYVIVEGEVVLSRAGRHVGVACAGDTLGELSALGVSFGPRGNHHMTTAMAITDIETCFVGAHTLVAYEGVSSLSLPRSRLYGESL